MFTKYIEAGYSVIPLRKREKRPFLTNWSKWCDVIATESEYENWETLYKDFNIGLCLGSASGVMALDIDTDDTQTLMACPMSPVVKRGKKGETRFFKYNPNIKAAKFHDIGIEVLSTGNQTVLPPSIHPDGMHYLWLTVDAFPYFDKNELPELINIDFINKIFRKNLPVQQGRNDTLKTIVSAIAFKNEKTLIEVIDEICEFDKNMHPIQPLFSDKSEFSNENPRKNAEIFVKNIYKSLKIDPVCNKKEVASSVPAFSMELLDLFKKEIFETKDLPRLPGILSELTDEILIRSHAFQLNFAQASALTLFCGFCDGRYRGEITSIREFSMLVGPSGIGKNAPQKFIKQFLFSRDFFNYNLLGFENFTSDLQLYKTFPEQRTRIDVYDEFSDFLKSYESPDSFQGKISSLFIDLWDNNNEMFRRGKTELREGVSCHSPGVSILTAIQDTSLERLATIQMFERGFLPRFNIYWVNKKNGINLNPKPMYEAMPHQLIKKMKDTFPYPKVATRADEPPASRIVSISHEAKNYLSQIALANYENNNTNTVESSIAKRHYQKVVRLTLAIALSNGRVIASLDDTKTAHEYLTALESQSTWRLSESVFESRYSRSICKIKNVLEANYKKTGNRSIRSDILANLFPEDLFDREKSLKELEAMSIVSRDPSKKTVTYLL